MALLGTASSARSPADHYRLTFLRRQRALEFAAGRIECVDLSIVQIADEERSGE
jgi:hypothetical protein